MNNFNAAFHGEVKSQANLTFNRKIDHLRICLNKNVSFIGKSTGFNDVEFIHNALPEIDFDLHDFHKKMFEKWLVRAIDNAINENALPNKQILIIKGHQNSRKTSFLR